MPRGGTKLELNGPRKKDFQGGGMFNQHLRSKAVSKLVGRKERKDDADWHRTLDGSEKLSSCGFQKRVCNGKGGWNFRFGQLLRKAAGLQGDRDRGSRRGAIGFLEAEREAMCPGGFKSGGRGRRFSLFGGGFQLKGPKKSVGGV